MAGKDPITASQTLTTHQQPWADLRASDFRRMSLGWYVVILLLFPLTMALTFVLDSVLAGHVPSLFRCWANTSWVNRHRILRTLQTRDGDQ